MLSQENCEATGLTDVAIKVKYSSPIIRQIAGTLAGEVEALVAQLESCGLTLHDVGMPGKQPYRGDQLLHDALLNLLLAPFLVLGRMCWMLPLHVAHTIALYTLRFDPSRDQPAMRTILISLATVPAWYALQALAVAASVNGIGAALWIMIVLFASVLDTCCRDGHKQGPRRVRARLVPSAPISTGGNGRRSRHCGI